MIVNVLHDPLRLIQIVVTSMIFSYPAYSLLGDVLLQVASGGISAIPGPEQY